MENVNGEISAGTDRARVYRAKCRTGLVYWATPFISSNILWEIAGVDPIKSTLGKLAPSSRLV